MNEIVLENVTKSYHYKVVLDRVNLSLTSGKIIGLLGNNGSGKTTLIKLITGLVKQDQGNIRINGMMPGNETKKIISYLPERFSLDRSKKVGYYLSYFADFFDDFDLEKAKNLLQQNCIDEKSRLYSLSKGTIEKVSIILVMSRKADCYLLDEPMSGVDPVGRDEILDTILSGFDVQATILISTHLITDIERILDEVIFIKDGKILAHEQADCIRQRTNQSIDEYYREVYRR